MSVGIVGVWHQVQLTLEVKLRICIYSLATEPQPQPPARKPSITMLGLLPLDNLGYHTQNPGSHRSPTSRLCFFSKPLSARAKAVFPVPAAYQEV